MKLIKGSGVLALLAVAAMAVTASTASANATVCTNDTAHQDTALCGESHGKHAKLGSLGLASLVPGTKAVLTVTNSSGGTVRVVECSTSTTSSKITSTTGGGSIESLTFGSCVSSGCSNVSASTPRAGKSFPWASTATTLAGTDGVLHIVGPSGKFTATCFFITATCEYEATTATATIKGGTPATIEASAVPLTRTAGAESICGTKADWTAKYTVTTPSSIFIT